MDRPVERGARKVGILRQGDKTHADTLREHGYVSLQVLEQLLPGVDRKTIRSWIHGRAANPLPAFQPGGARGKIWVRLVDFHAWMAAHSISAGLDPKVIASMEAAIRNPESSTKRRRA